MGNCTRLCLVDGVNYLLREWLDIGQSVRLRVQNNEEERKATDVLLESHAAVNGDENIELTFRIRQKFAVG
jgi:hypothetical protein